MIVVCEKYKKDEILKEMYDKPLKQIKFLSKSQFIKSFYFDYDKRTIYELCRKYCCSYDTALIYLNNLYYIDNKKYNNEKLDKLVDIKNFLLDNNLLKVDSLFKEYIKGQKIIFNDYNFDKFDLLLISELKKITEVEIREKIYNNYNPVIYEFKTIDEEVEYVAFKICELIDSGVSLSDIKISGINDDYNNSINRIFKMYNLKISEGHSIYSTKTVREFIKNYQSDISKTIDILKINKYDSKVIDKIIDVVNEYNFVNDYELVKDLVINDLKRSKLVNHFDNEIEIIDILNNNIKDEYVFYLNYNQESIPRIHLDKDYITDDIRHLTKLDSIEDLNKTERRNIARALKNIKNLTITYKLKSPFANFSKANVLDIVSTKGIIPTNINYSTLSNKVNLTKMLDNLVKYGEIDDNLSLFNKHYKIDYNSYDNSYKVLETKDLYDFIDNKLTLSYTSMNDYYKCSFKYYLKYILKIDKQREVITRHIGSIFHFCLEKGLKADIDIENTILEYLDNNNICLTVKEKFFLDKLKEELPFLIDTIKKQDDYILLKKRLYEEKINIEFDDKIDIKFVGIIDKIMYDNDIYALIDYKTGQDSIDLTLNYYGINMQLATYLYLASNRFENAHFAGFYLQYILNKLSKSDDISKKTSNLKLVGYSNTKYIASFDKTYKNSSLIKSLKVKNDNSFYSTSKVLSDSEIANLIKLADSKIKECMDKIINADFKINPKHIDGKNIGCEYCDYKDICFMKNKDIVYLEKQDNFL